jgi:CubicO group peptidase (beta-lactamase class C family)
LEGKARWAQALPALYQYPFVDHPGRRVIYSDIGLILLGHALEVISGLALEQVIQVQVLGPLGLSRTLFNPVQQGFARLDEIAPTELDLRWRQRRVWGEVHDENACALGGVAGHAGLFSTAMDVALFGQVWLSEPHKMGIDARLARLAKSELACTDDVRRGLGFVIKSHQNASAGDHFSPQTFGHTGFTGTTLWVDPDRHCVVACLTNGIYAGRAQHAPHTFRRLLHDLIAHSMDFGGVGRK